MIFANEVWYILDYLCHQDNVQSQDVITARGLRIWLQALLYLNDDKVAEKTKKLNN